jgi:hypothetical protein
VYLTECAVKLPACANVRIENLVSSSDVLNMVGQSPGYVNTTVTTLHFIPTSKVSFFPSNIGKIFTNLQFLVMEDNGISNMASNVVDNCGNLVQLLMFNQQFPHLPAAFAQNCNKLSILFARNSKISTLDPNALQGLTALLSAYIDYNEIQTIPSGFFAHTPSLLEISLMYNQICAVDPLLFKGYPNLVGIDLSNNRFSYLKNLDLTGTGSITNSYGFRVKFHGNPIVAINPQLFDSIFQSGYQRTSYLFLYSETSKVFNFSSYCFAPSTAVVEIIDSNWVTAKSGYKTCFDNWTPDLANATCEITTTTSTTTSTTSTTLKTTVTSQPITISSTLPPQTTVITLAPTNKSLPTTVAPSCSPITPPSCNPSKVLEVILSAFRNMTFSVNFN